MRPISKLAALANLLFLFSARARSATVTGTVKGPDGAPFEGAFVVAQSTKTKISVSVLSDKQGRYRVENLPEGDYQVRVRAVGFAAEVVLDDAARELAHRHADHRGREDRDDAEGQEQSRGEVHRGSLRFRRACPPRSSRPRLSGIPWA